MDKLDKKPTFLENVDMMINQAIDRIDIDENIAKILKICRSVIQVKFPVKIDSIEHIPCITCPDEERCSATGVVTPFNCLLIENWVIAEQNKMKTK